MKKTVAGSLPRIFFLAGFLLIQVPGITASQEPDSPGIRLSDLVEWAEVRLLLLDIVVTDKKGNLITDLTQDDFQLLIDGQPVAIDSFELVSFRRPPSVVGELASAPDAPESPAPGQRRRENLVILFFDVFNSGNAGMNRMWERAREFLEEGTPVFDQVMIIVYSDRLRVPQPFSADPTEWLRTLDSLEEELVNRDSYVERESSRMETINEICKQGPCNKPTKFVGESARVSYCVTAWSMVQAYTQDEATRALMTLRALNGLVLGLGGLEGRKSVVYFSEGIRRTPGRQYAAAARCPACACQRGDVYTEHFRVDLEMDKIFRTANTANVTFHTIDVRSTDRSITTGGWVSGTEDFLDNFAFHTGGLRGVASAKPKKNFKRLEERIGTFYILGHELDQMEPDEKIHNIIIRMARKNIRVMYRKTFQDIGWQDREERSLRGALFIPELYTDIFLEARVVSFPQNDGRADVYIEMGMRMSRINWIPTPLGELGEVEFAGAVMGPKGGVKHQFRYQLELKKGKGEGEIGRRLFYLDRTELAPGEYELLAAVHDIGGRQIGASRLSFVIPKRSKKEFRLTGPVLARFSANDLVTGVRPPYTRVDGLPPEFQDRALSPVLDGTLFSRDLLLAYFRVSPPGSGSAAGVTASPAVSVSILQEGRVLARPRPTRIGGGEAGSKEFIDYAAWAALEKLAPGVYDLRVEVIPNGSGEKLRKEVSFRVASRME